MSANLLYSDDAVIWRRSVDQLEGASFFMNRKTGSRFRVKRRLVDRAVDDDRNKDAWALPTNDVCGI